MRLYFLRHGESVNNALEGAPDYLSARDSEPDLTDYGRKQAERTAEFIAGKLGNGEITPPESAHNPYSGAGFGITHIYSSPHLRALRTAAPTADSLALPVTVYEDIHEAGGVFEYDAHREVFVGASGLSKRHALSLYETIEYPNHLPDDGWWGARPMEDEHSRMARAARVREYVLANHEAQDHVLFVSHCHFYVYFMCEVLGIPYREGLWFTLNNCALTRITFDHRGVRVDYQNRQDYLYPSLLG